MYVAEAIIDHLEEEGYKPINPGPNPIYEPPNDVATYYIEFDYTTYAKLHIMYNAVKVRIYNCQDLLDEAILSINDPELLPNILKILDAH